MLKKFKVMEENRNTYETKFRLTNEWNILWNKTNEQKIKIEALSQKIMVMLDMKSLIEEIKNAEESYESRIS